MLKDNRRICVHRHLNTLAFARWVSGAGLRGWGLGISFWEAVFMVWNLRFRFQGVRLAMYGVRYTVWGFGCRVYVCTVYSLRCSVKGVGFRS